MSKDDKVEGEQLTHVRCTIADCTGIYVDARSHRAHWRNKHKGIEYVNPEPCAAPKPQADLSVHTLTNEDIAALAFEHFKHCRVSRSRKIVIADAIRIFHNCSQNAASVIWFKILEKAKNLSLLSSNERFSKDFWPNFVSTESFPGTGSTNVPVAPFWVIVLILSEIPREPKAMLLRAEMAKIFVRVYAGDLDTLKLIERQRGTLDPVARALAMEGLAQSAESKEDLRPGLEKLQALLDEAHAQLDEANAEKAALSANVAMKETAILKVFTKNMQLRKLNKKRKFQSLTGKAYATYDSYLAAEVDALLDVDATTGDEKMLRPTTFGIVHNIAHGIVAMYAEKGKEDKLRCVRKAVADVVVVDPDVVAADVTGAHASNHIRLYTLICAYMKQRLPGANYSTEMPLRHAYVYAVNYNRFMWQFGRIGSSIPRDILLYQPDINRLQFDAVADPVGHVEPPAAHKNHLIEEYFAAMM